MFWKLFLFVLITWAVYYRRKRRRIYRVTKEVPCSGLTELPILGHAYLYAGNDEDRMSVLQKFGQIAVQRGGLAYIWMVNKLYIVIADPVVAEVVMKTCLDKDDTTMRYLREITGNGNIFAPVSVWRHRRKIVMPIFSIKNLNCFVPVFAEQSIIMVRQLEKEAGKEDFCFWKYMTTYTFDAICKTSLGIDLKTQQKSDHPFLDAVDVAVELMAERLCKPWLYLDCIYQRLSRYKTFVSKRDLIYKFVDELIKSKQTELAERSGHMNDSGNKGEMKTFLEMLIESSGREKGYSEIELREEVLVIILAGTDTSAVGAAFTALMLSRYPDVQQMVYEELQEVFGISDRPATVQDLPRLKYLEAVIKETLRLYPAVPVVVREVFNDVKLPTGTTLVDGVGLLINFCAIHRNPSYWGEDAHMFRPERFLEGPLKHPGQYMPFSYSLRNCPGSTYAMMSMKTVLSTLLRRYRLLPPSTLPSNQWTDPLRIKFDVMMKNVDNYMIRIEDRNRMSDFAVKYNYM